MPFTALKSCALALLPALAATFLIQACGGSDDAFAQAASGAESIEGLWESVVQQVDCTSGAVLGTFSGTQVFHRGGTLNDTDGSLAGSTRVVRNLTLSADGNSTTSNNTLQIRAVDGSVLQSGCANDISTRFK